MISFDNATGITYQVGVTSLTGAHTVGTGGNRILFVSAKTIGIAGRDSITGITYAGTSMTLVDKKLQATDNHYVYLYYLIAPTSGSNNVVISCSESATIGGCAASYAMVKQSGQPDSFNDGTAISASSIAISTTVVLPQCWLISLCDTALVGLSSAGTGTTQRATDTHTMNLGDSNGTVSTGSQSMTWTGGPGEDFVQIIASFAPANTGGFIPILFS